MRQAQIVLTLALALLVASKRPVSYIKVGLKVSHDAYPFLVLIATLADDSKLQYCGGTILNRLFVLTAAHCFVNPTRTNITGHNVFVSPKQIRVYAGFVDEDQSGRIRGRHKLKVIQIIPHESYISSSLDSGIGKLKHDIALIRLAVPINFTHHRDLSPVVLADWLGHFTLDRCVVVGRGPPDDDPTSRELHRGLITLKQYWYQATKLLLSQKVSSPGDSGSPALCYSTAPFNNPSKRRFMAQVAVVKGGFAFSTIDQIPTHTIYTSVSDYNYWILSNGGGRHSITLFITLFILILSLPIFFSIKVFNV